MQKGCCKNINIHVTDSIVKDQWMNIMLKKIPLFLLLVLFAMPVLAPKLEGVTTNWLGTTDNDLNNSMNWSAGVPTGSDIAVFTATGSVTLIDGSAFIPQGIVFSSASNFVLNLSNGLNLGINGVSIQGTSANQIFNCSVAGVTFAASAPVGTSAITYNLSSTAPLTFSGGTSSIVSDMAVFNLTDATTTLSAAGSATNVYVGQFTSNSTVAIGTNNNLNINAPSPAASSISGVISGNGGLGVTGSGTLTVSAANTYFGTTNVTGGTLKAGAANTFSSNSPVVMGTASTAVLNLNNNPQAIPSLSGGGASGGNVSLGSGTLSLSNGSGGSSYGGAITGTGGITLTGGTFTLTGNSNTYSGTTNVIAGTFQGGAVDAFSASSRVAMTNAVGATLDLDSNNQVIGSLSGGGNLGGNVTLETAILSLGGDNTSTSFAGSITGTTGGITKQGTGVFTLTGTSNAYSGATTVSAGTLRAGAIDAFASASHVVMANVAGANLGLDNYNQTIAALSGGGTSGGNVSLGTATLTTGDASNTTFSGAISGAGGITLQGTGIFTLNGTNNSYTGTTSVTSGTLQGGAVNAFAPLSTVVMTDDSAAVMDLNSFNQTIGSLSGGGASGGNVLLTGGAILTLGGDNSSTTYSGSMSLTGGITKQGSGTFTLSGTNTYSGPTTVNAGTLIGGASNSLSQNSAIVMANTAGATLSLSASQIIGSLAGGGAVGGNVSLGSFTLTTGFDNTNTTYSGAISGTGGLTKIGSGVFTLNGSNNTYLGTTTVTAGTLQAGAVNTFSSSSAVSMNNAIGATLALNGFDQTIASLTGGGTLGGNVTLGSGTLTTGGSNASTSYGGAISGTGGLTKVGTGVFALSGASLNTYSGETNVEAGTLQGGAVNAFSPNSDVVMADVSGAILDLNNNSQVIATLSGGGVLGGNVTLGSGTLTTGDDTSTVYGGAISGIGGGLVKQGTGGFTLTGTNNTYSGTTTVNAGSFKGGAVNAYSPNSAVVMANVSGAELDLMHHSQVIASLAGGGTSGGNVKLGSGTLTTGNSSNTVYSGAISGTGGITKQGSGVFTLSGTNNTYSGTTTVNAGTLRGGAVNAFSPNSAVVMADVSGAILSLNGNSQVIASLSGGGNTGGHVALGAGTLTTGNGTNTTYNGVISGSGGVTLVGTGIFSLTGTNTYTGTTYVAQGTLNLNGSVAGNAVVGSGAFLTGNGTVFGNLTVNYQGNVSPGNSIGQLTVGSYTNNGGNYDVEINGSGQSDQLISVGPAVINGGYVVVSTVDGTYDIGEVYTIVTASSVTGTYSGAFAANSLVMPVLSYDPTHVYLGLRLAVSNAAQTCNQFSVAEQLDNIGSPNSSLQAILNTLINLSVDDVADVLDEMSGQQHTSDLFATTAINRQFIRRMYDPIRHIVTSKLLVQSFYHPCYGCDYDVNHEDFEFWVEGGPKCTHVNGTKSAHGFNMNGYELTIGAQKTFTPNVTCGLAGSYEKDHFHYACPGKGRSQTWFGGAYGLYRSLFHYVLADVAYSFSSNTMHRFINIGPSTYRTYSKPRISQITFYGETGVDYQYGGLLIQPFGGLEVGAFKRMRTVESGTSDWNLIVNKKERATVTSRLGVHLTANHLPYHSSLSCDIAWNKRLTSDNNSISEQFVNFGDKFTIDGVIIDSNSLDLAITGSTTLYDCWRFYVEGAAEVWNRAYNLNFIGGVEFTW